MRLSLDFLMVGNWPFLKGWVKPNLPLKKHLSFLHVILFHVSPFFLCIWLLTCSCNFLTKSVLDTFSLCTNSCGLEWGNKSKGVTGLKSYTTSKGEISILLWTIILHANSMWWRYLSQNLWLFFKIILNMVVKDLLTTRICLSIWE